MDRIVQKELVEDPFGYPLYYSSSQRKVISVDEMPLPYALNVLNRLGTDYPDDFKGSVLQKALYERLYPTTDELAEILQKNGVASCWAGSEEHTRKSARSKLYRAAGKIGKKVRTETHGKFIEAVVDTEMEIRVTRR